MKNKKLILLLCLSLSMVGILSAEEITFEAGEIDVLEKGNIIKTSKGTAHSFDDGVKIDANRFYYNKELLILKATDNTVTSILKKKIIINADNITYNKGLSTLDAFGDVMINDFANNISLKSTAIFFDIKNQKIESKSTVLIKDNFGNLITSEGFIFTLSDKIIKLNDLKLTDIQKNIYQIDTAFMNINSKKLIGKDISIDLNNQSLNTGNEPRLKGNSVSSDLNETIINKGVFTTCKNNDTCPPWQISADEIKHNKKSQTISYKNAWLKLYDVPVFYFPKFFHPDPTVKRRSGFLIPSIQDSSNTGGSFNLPYFHVISKSKDVTIRPRFYTDNKILTQSEYRAVNENSKHLFDFSFISEKDQSMKSHIFLNSSKKLNYSYFDESELNFKLEQVTNDTYLKTYKLKSPIINDYSSLKSFVEFSAHNEDLILNIDFKIYEDLTKEKSDRYEYILPNYNMIKEFEQSSDSAGIISLDSSGYVKNYSTNITEKIVINDLIFKSNSKYTDSGLVNNYNFLIKSVNSEGKKSPDFEDGLDHKLLTLLEYNSSYPLKKSGGNYTNILKPKVSMRYSPNNTRNLRNTDSRIDNNNIFSLNRISKKDTIEGGSSLTFGTDFVKSNKLNNELLNISLANVIRAKENNNLSASSSLGEKTSDIFGNIDYSPNKFISG